MKSLAHIVVVLKLLVAILDLQYEITIFMIMVKMHLLMSIL